MRNLTIVMYHYVRDMSLRENRGLKALELSLFSDQLDYLADRYTPVSVEDVIEAVDQKTALPSDACLLTFDDGYLDHFSNVFPLLKRKGITGAFYSPFHSVENRVLLDVNKIHFLLARNDDHDLLVKRLLEALAPLRRENSLESDTHFLEEYCHKNRFDEANTAFIKRMLQFVLPEAIRNKITDDLFRQLVSEDEREFADSLYMTMEQLASMREAGMHIGSHGYRHEWLGRLDPQEQEREIRRSVECLDAIGADKTMRTICYPYGDFNDSLLAILAPHGFRLGMATIARRADLDTDAPLTLPRIDTNDITREMNQPEKDV